jgi:hypothetical protein
MRTYSEAANDQTAAGSGGKAVKGAAGVVTGRQATGKGRILLVSEDGSIANSAGRKGILIPPVQQILFNIVLVLTALFD